MYTTDELYREETSSMAFKRSKVMRLIILIFSILPSINKFLLISHPNLIHWSPYHHYCNWVFQGFWSPRPRMINFVPRTWMYAEGPSTFITAASFRRQPNASCRTQGWLNLVTTAKLPWCFLSPPKKKTIYPTRTCDVEIFFHIKSTCFVVVTSVTWQTFTSY